MVIQQSKNILLTFILISIGISNSIACNCQGEGTVAASVEYFDVIFSGEVISITSTNNYDSLGVETTGEASKLHSEWSKFPSISVQIKIDKIYKGQVSADTLIILTPLRGSSCGYRFKVGEKYIVYATIFDELLMTHNLKRRAFDNKTFWTHQCTRTQNWNITEETELLKETTKE